MFPVSSVKQVLATTKMVSLHFQMNPMNGTSAPRLEVLESTKLIQLQC